MKNLLVAALLIITLASTSSVFIHFSLNLMQPSSAEKLNSHLIKWERTFKDYLLHHRQKGLDYASKSLEMFDDASRSDPVFVKQCSRTCSLPSIGVVGPPVKDEATQKKTSDRVNQGN
jgi:hypothetical protein